MDLTNRTLAKARSEEEEGLAKAKYSRGISARACVTKTMTWELASAKGVPAYDASSIEASLSHTNWEDEKTTN